MTQWQVDGPGGCAHLDDLPVAPREAAECADCIREGTRWVHLRRCLTCDHVGCCDSSPHEHATAHWRATGHPVVASAEPREHWAWCYADELILVPHA